jgi:hypothetical protein
VKRPAGRVIISDRQTDPRGQPACRVRDARRSAGNKRCPQHGSYGGADSARTARAPKGRCLPALHKRRAFQTRDSRRSDAWSPLRSSGVDGTPARSDRTTLVVRCRLSVGGRAVARSAIALGAAWATAVRDVQRSFPQIRALQVRRGRRRDARRQRKAGPSKSVTCRSIRNSRVAPA